jgi:hypothetical protein
MTEQKNRFIKSMTFEAIGTIFYTNGPIVGHIDDKGHEWYKQGERYFNSKYIIAVEYEQV